MPHHSNDGAGSNTAGSGWFLTTQWTWLSKASDRHSMESIEARELLCKTYWRPLYNFIRRKGHSPEDAEDLTQSFFAVLLEKNFWERANPEKGRFRCLLLKALTQYLLDQRDRANTAKRGKGISIISLDRDDEDGRTFDAPARDGSPEEHFNRSWAWALLQQAREKLREEYTAKGKVQLYQSVDLFCDRPDEGPPYAVIARQLGMSVGALKTAVSRMRERYCTLVRQEVARTVGSPEEIDAEIEFLFSAIAK